MPSKKDIRNRIRSVQNTQKITKAMKLIAIIKSKQLQNALTSVKPYSESLNSMLGKVISYFQSEQIDFNENFNENISSLIRPSLNDDNPCLLIITSDRGLCSSYNSQVLKIMQTKIESLLKEGKKPKLILIGSKSSVFVQKNFASLEILHKYTNISILPTINEAESIYALIEKECTEGNISSVEIIYNEFISMIKSQVKKVQLIPFNTSNLEISKENIKDQNITLFEPSVLEIANVLIPLYCKNQILKSLILARTSELAHRVNAMGAATDNAKSLINQLTLSYNKARQSSITQEIAEIVSGAESLK